MLSAEVATVPGRCSVGACSRQAPRPLVRAPTIQHRGTVRSRSKQRQAQRGSRHALPAAAADVPQHGSQQPAGGLPALPAPLAAFYDAFARRSADGMAACLAPDACLVNLSLSQEPFQGRDAVRGVLAGLVASAPPGWRLVLDDALVQGGSGGSGGDGAAAAASAVAVVYHLEDGSGRAVPLSRGLAFYRLDAAGRICRITESSEQAVKVPQAALPALGAAGGLLQALGDLAAGSLPAPLQPAVAPVAAPPSGGGTTAMVSSAGLGWAGSPPSGSSSTSTSTSSRRDVGVRAASSTGGGGGGSGDGGGSIGGLQGTWIKDAAASDLASYGRACDLMQLKGLQKTTAMQLIEGVEVEQRGAEVAIRFLTVVPFFKVEESVRLGGGATSMSRRDLRSGRQQATAVVDGDPASGGCLRVSITWAEPNAGGVTEEYRLLEGGAALECLSTVAVAAGRETTRSVFRRADAWKPRFAWSPLAALSARGLQQP